MVECSVHYNGRPSALFRAKGRYGRPTNVLCWHKGRPIVSEYVNKVQNNRIIRWYCWHPNRLVLLQRLQLWSVLTTAGLVALNSGYRKSCGCQTTDASYSIRETRPVRTHYTLIHLTWQAWNLTQWLLRMRHLRTALPRRRIQHYQPGNSLG